MIIFYGPPGAGKSLQGQILAMRYGWKWLSMSQMLRDSGDPEILAIMKTGQIVPNEITNEIAASVLTEDSVCGEKGGVILDGYPRVIEQAQFLVDHEIRRCENHNINLVIVIDMDKDEIMKRLALRGRTDDDVETIERRLQIYHETTEPILGYFEEQRVPVVHVDGNGKVGSIHDAIEAELASHGII